MQSVGIIVHTINAAGGSVILVGKEGMLLREKYPNGLVNSNGISYLQGDIEGTENIEYYHGSDVGEAEHYFLETSRALSMTIGVPIQYESPKSTEDHGWYTNYWYLPQDSQWTVPRLSSTDDDRKALVTLLEGLGFNVDKYSITYLFTINGYKFFLRIFLNEIYVNLSRNGQHCRFFDIQFKVIEDCVANRNTFEPISRLAIEHYDSLGYSNSLG
jgi:hypothetical protein